MQTMNDIERNFVVDFVPRTKKNSMEIRKRRDGTQFVSPSWKYQRWEADVAEVLAALNKYRPPINYPVNVREVFYLPDHRRRDLLNLQEAIDDALVRAGVLADDALDIVAGHDGSHALIDRDRPRIVITITKAEDWQILREV